MKICNVNVNHEIEIYAFTAYGLHAILQHKFSVRKQYEKKNVVNVLLRENVFITQIGNSPDP